jgi:ABC-type glycerol-3-phosphate transport system substrate-binding protein
MSISRKLSRREFLKVTGAGAAGAALAAAAPGLASAAAPTKAFGVPMLLQNRTINVAMLQSPHDQLQTLLDSTGYSKQSGIDVNILIRSDTKETEFAKITSAVQAGTSPYDVLDFEDELATTLSRAGYFVGVDDLLPSDFWDDFSPAMVEYTKVWSTLNDETFRVVHNWEMPIWWYRKDWFDAKGVAVPTTWDEVAGMGKVFTDESTGVWATEDGLVKGAFLNVYLAWITLQAGGNPFDVGDPYKVALQYIYDLMHDSKTMNPASLQNGYDQQNADYFADKVAFMRQWPYFGGLARNSDNAAWFTTEDKAAIALPPVGPGGVGGSTYAAAWGWGLIKTSPNLDAAKEFYTWLVSKDTAVEAAKQGEWFFNARKSVLDAADQESWLVKQVEMYTEAGAIGVRPFHPQFVEALTILEDNASAFFTDQTSLDDTLLATKDQLAALGETTPSS